MIKHLSRGVFAALALQAALPTVSWLPDVRQTDTSALRQLSADDRRSLLADIANSSFDTPSSWNEELRARAIAPDLLIVRGTQLLCGGTGNCQTWIFRRVHGRWTNLVGGETPIAERLGFVGSAATAGDLVTTANLSADTEQWTRYVFDGHLYQMSVCYRVTTGASRAVVSRVACGRAIRP
jgi:hypothetical protein